MLLVGKLAAGRYFWLRHGQVVGRERPACAKLSKERCRTHINLGSARRARAQALSCNSKRIRCRGGMDAKGCKRDVKGDE